MKNRTFTVTQYSSFVRKFHLGHKLRAIAVTDQRTSNGIKKFRNLRHTFVNSSCFISQFDT